MLKITGSPDSQFVKVNHESWWFLIIFFRRNCGPSTMMNLELLMSRYWYLFFDSWYLNLNFSLNVIYNFIKVVFTSYLKFLMMTSALVGCPLNKNFWELIKHFFLPPGRFAFKILSMFNQEGEIDLNFFKGPPSLGLPVVSESDSYFFCLMEFRLIRFLFLLSLLSNFLPFEYLFLFWLWKINLLTIWGKHGFNV